MKILHVGVLQNSASCDIENNLTQIDSLLARYNQRLDIIALTEVFAYRGKHTDYRRLADTIWKYSTRYAEALARARNAWVLAGSIPEKVQNKIYNTSILFNREGKISALYRKIHLFEAFLDNEQRIAETDIFTRGTTPVTANIEGWTAGLSICYDLRFPELYRQYSKEGANILFIPSNFTQRTGRDHWQTLVRARAIENQCFVIAPDQCGKNEVTGIQSYGHSMIVGPWGEILAKASNREVILTVSLNPNEIKRTRHRIPALKHRVL